MLALIEGNNFYNSCGRVFQPWQDDGRAVQQRRLRHYPQ
jgi:hypothetical protein